MHAQLADAEDAYSEAFLSALRGYPDLPEDANLEAWLIRIARNACIDVHRRNARQPVPVARLPEVPHLSSAAPSGDGAIGAHAIGASASGDDVDVIALLWQLTDRQRTAIAYHYIWGLPYAEVAVEIGGSPAAARRAAADGIAALRRLVMPEKEKESKPAVVRSSTEPHPAAAARASRVSVRGTGLCGSSAREVQEYEER